VALLAKNEVLILTRLTLTTRLALAQGDESCLALPPCVPLLPLELITKNVAFFRPFFFFFSLGCMVRFFYCVFGRFVTRGVQKRDLKRSRGNLLSSQKK
jgi:hypothetical protein